MKSLCPVWIGVSMPNMKRCDQEVVVRVIWHDDGYENRKWVGLCAHHRDVWNEDASAITW